MLAYKRIVLKLSGESLKVKGSEAVFDPQRVEEMSKVLHALASEGAQLAVVFGGGNIWRGRFSKQMDAVSADQMGMLATILNALCVREALTRMGQRAEVFTAQEMNRFARLYTRDDALALMEAGGVALLAGGTGNPFCTTDSAAALRAAELRADAVFKGTQADGVCAGDPKKHPELKAIPDLTYDRALEERLEVMDMAAYLTCRDQGVPCIRVFNNNDPENILRAARGEPIGSIVHP